MKSNSFERKQIKPRKVLKQKPSGLRNRQKRNESIQRKIKKRKEIQKTLPPKAPKNIDFYLDKKGKVSLEKVEKYKETIHPSVLMRLNFQSPGLIRSVFCEPKTGPNWTFRCFGNLMVQKRISLVEVLYGKFLKKVIVNDRPTCSKGPGGPYFFEKSPHGYAAILEGTSIQEPKKGKREKEEIKKIQKQIKAPPKPQEKKALELYAKTSRVPQKESDYRGKYILTSARLQGVPLGELTKILVNHDYPVGFYAITKGWSFETRVTCTARGLKMNMEKYKSMGLTPFIKGKREFSKEFLHFNKTGKLYAKVTPKKKSSWISYKPRYRRSTKAHPTVFIEPTNIPRHIAHAQKFGGPKYRRRPAMKALGKDGIDTFKNTNGRLYGKYQIPSENLFAGTVMCSSRPLKQMRTANLVLFSHGTAGFNSPGRYINGMRNSGNSITAAPEDFAAARLHRGKKYNGYPYYAWNNLAAPGGREKFIRYFGRLVAAIEAAGPKVTSVSLAGHSGGGFANEKYMKYFGSDGIPYTDPVTGEKRKIRINLVMDADSQYYGPEAATHGYCGNQYFKAIKNDNLVQKYANEGNKDDLKKRIQKLCGPILEHFLSVVHKHYRHAEGGIKSRIRLEPMIRAASTKLIEMLTQKAISGKLQSFKPMTYVSTYTKRGWKHQRAMQSAMAELARTEPSVISRHAASHGKAFSRHFSSALNHRS